MVSPHHQESQLIPCASADAAGGEVPPPGEAEAISAIVAMIERRVVAAAAGRRARRDAHPKAHGCVSAEFHVLDDVPAPLRVGLFTHARVYPAWIRFSNGLEAPRPDRIGDGRGMAIKVLGVEASRSTTQDFIMINNPTFFVRDAADYVAFQSASNPLRFFFPSWNPFRIRLRELLVARAITAQKVANPLDVRYWSMTPYLWGDRACKFSARPSDNKLRFGDTSAPDFLRDNLRAQLTQTGASFDFLAQQRTHANVMPIEDPRIEWREAAAPFVPIARIVIPRQTFDTAEREAFGEALSFTPWHGLDVHRPLGGINRARRVVYETVSRVRHELNDQVRAEPQEGPSARI